MKRKKNMIGFSQRIRLDWLEYTANLALAGNSRDEIVAALRGRLRDQLSVGKDPERGNREKAITILTKVWVTAPNELQSLRDEGLGLLQHLSPGDRMLVHWCMCMAVYPFFGTVAEATGRLLHLQGTAAAAQVQRRVREQRGERETASRAARRILRAFVDWGVLAETLEKGIYRGSSKRVIDDMPLIIWVIKAILAARGDTPLSLSGALRGPYLLPDRLGDNATKDFVLLHVFEIAAALIKQPPELLRVLLRRHYRGQRIPRLLDDRFVQVLRQSGAFESWPIETIVQDREAFFSFLQERWPLFLDRLAADAGGSLQEEGELYGLEIEGPKDLPFDHDDVRVYIDNLFVEGLLRPVTHRCSNALSDKWVAAGVRIDPAADRLRRLDGLIETVSATIPTPEAKHRDWSVFAYRWSELSVLWSDVTSIAPSETSERVGNLRSAVDQAFMAWIERRYAGLYNQPPDPPAMVHHLPRYLARQLSDSVDRKVALVVVDGIALDQWIVLRDVLADQRPRFRLREGAVFAWVPTITSVSRQAAFAGKPPLYFPSSIHTTDKEPSLWTQFWVDHGLTMREVGYAKGLGDGSLDGVRELASRPRLRALGLVVDKVDKIMHGMELGTAGMHNQVNQWAKQQFMADLLDVLFDHGFDVVLTSDHGNIEAEGCGRPSEGAVADLRGERARVYPDELLRSRVKERFAGAIEWPALGLPEDYFPLLAPRRSAFIREGERIVGHGGISLEEIVVPMVQVERLAE